MAKPTGHGSRGDAPCIVHCMNCRSSIGRRPSSVRMAWCPRCANWVHIYKTPDLTGKRRKSS